MRTSMSEVWSAITAAIGLLAMLSAIPGPVADARRTPGVIDAEGAASAPRNRSIERRCERVGDSAVTRCG